MSSPDPSTVTLAVLAGGEGARMGKPKALLEIAHQPILAWYMNQLRWPGPTVLVTAPGRTHPPAANRFSREVSDTVPNQGPLRGILTALQSSNTDLTLITTVDMPAVQSLHLHFMIEFLHAHPHLAGFFFTRAPNDQPLLEPFPCALRTALALPIVQDLIPIRRAVHALAHQPGFTTLPTPSDWPSHLWTNLNHPADLEAFMEHLKQHSPGSGS